MTVKTCSRMWSLSITSFLPLLLETLFQTAIAARKSSLLEVTCDQYASCAPGVDHVNTCFCDRLCRVYDDCCPDFVDEEHGRPLTSSSPLPLQFFSCISDMFPFSVYVVTECPETYQVQFVLDGCRHGSMLSAHPPPPSEVFYAVPVSSRTSGLLYRNVYCAVCHEEQDVSYWNVTATRCAEPHNSEVTLEPGVEKADDLVEDNSLPEGCMLSYTAPSDTPAPRRCISNIGSCPAGSDPLVESQCTQPNSVAYVYYHHEVYRNHHCASCHSVAGYELRCNDSYHDSRQIGGHIESFAIVFDLNTGKGSAVGTGSDGSQTQRKGSCPDRHVYDPFAGTCRPVTCPPGQSFTEDGQCRPLTARAIHDVRSRSRMVYEESQPDDDFVCAWIQVSSSEYQWLANNSIYVPVHGATYDIDSYHVDVNDTAYVCTTFQRNYTTTVHEALRVDALGLYLSVICSVISLLALAFQFVVYMMFPVLRNTPGRCIICLVVSLFVGQLLFLLVKIGSSVSPWYCFGQAAVMHYAFLAAFFWMNVMAFDVYRTFGASPGAAASSSGPSAARRRFAAFSFYSWVSPAVLVALGVALDLTQVGGEYRPHYGRRICWFGSRGGLLVLFGSPVGLILVANIVMFVLSVRHIRNASKASQIAVQKTDQTQLLVIYVKLSVVMGLGWVLGFIAAFTDWPALWYIFIIINSLQGALLCMAFIVTRQVKRLLADCFRPLRRRTPSDTGVSTTNELSQSMKSATGHGEGTEVVQLSVA